MARRLVWPAITTLLMLALTVSLGIWQIHRLAWKTALLADIDRAEMAPPKLLGQDPPAFQRVVVEGVYRDEAARYGAEVRATAAGPAMGSSLITPLDVPGGATLMVDRGWVPDGADLPTPKGAVTVVGYIRMPEYPVRFGAADDPARRRFYALDPVAIGASLGISQVVPYTLVLLGPSTDTLPEPAVALPRPPNDHLSYAITWFALSAALVVVFLVYARATFRRGAQP